MHCLRWPVSQEDLLQALRDGAAKGQVSFYGVDLTLRIEPPLCWELLAKIWPHRQASLKALPDSKK